MLFAAPVSASVNAGVPLGQDVRTRFVTKLFRKRASGPRKA